MIESLHVEGLEGLRKGPGRKVNEVAIAEVEAGSVILIETLNNAYLFEIIDPKKPMANVVRCDWQPHTPRSGFLGERFLLTTTFEVGKIILYGESRTSKVEKITLLD